MPSDLALTLRGANANKLEDQFIWKLARATGAVSTLFWYHLAPTNATPISSFYFFPCNFFHFNVKIVVIVNNKFTTSKKAGLFFCS